LATLAALAPLTFARKAPKQRRPSRTKEISGRLNPKMIVLVPFMRRPVPLLEFLEPTNQPEPRSFCKTRHRNLLSFPFMFLTEASPVREEVAVITLCRFAVKQLNFG
jgi:hypothetical protein